MKPVAVDAMGGDHAPAAVVEGAALAARRGLGPIVLVGDQDAIRRAAASARLVLVDREPVDPNEVAVAHADEAIAMNESPVKAARTKRGSSLHVACGLVRDGRACGLVSAGNSGALMAVALLTLRRIPRCERPAIAAVLPTRGAPSVLLDVGANVECRAPHLAQFGIMGAAYAEIRLSRATPSVGLLSNGTEPSKGTELLREADALLKTTRLRYVGFIEGRDLPMGEVDVVVTDGFTGNVALKLSEGVALAVVERLKSALRTSVIGALGGLMARGALRSLKQTLDWGRTGGAPLLGIDGVVVAAHGSSSADAVANGIRVTRELAQLDLVGRLRASLAAADVPQSGTQSLGGLVP